MSRKELDLGVMADVRRIDAPRPTLVFSRDSRHPPDKVWGALTDPEGLAAWAPFVPDLALDEPGPVVLRMTDGDVTEEHAGRVLRASPPTLLEYTWGDDLLRWELEPNGSGTRITLRHTVDDADWLARVAAGWHLCLVVAERQLDGRPVGRIVGQQAKENGWDELHEAYTRSLSGRASTGERP
jgi:uncharacterized protein YndB with AHSA1/START domain